MPFNKDLRDLLRATKKASVSRFTGINRELAKANLKKEKRQLPETRPVPTAT